MDVIDATPQSPPLESDDPAVPGPGEFEINFTTDAEYAKTAQRVNLLSVDLNYGTRPIIFGYKLPTQIKFEFPITAGREAGQPVVVGPGAATFGIKLKFYDDEHRGISVAIYPQVGFSSGEAMRKDLAPNGQTVILPLLVAREFHEFTFVFNSAIEKPVHDPERQAAAELGLAFGRAFTRKVAAMIELRTESSLSFKTDRLLFVNAGLVHGVRRIVWYANVGHSLFADDGFSHLYAGAGIKTQIETKKKQG